MRAEGSGVFPAKDGLPGRGLQILDKPSSQDKNAGVGDACFAEEIATTMNYEGAMPAAELT